MARVLLQSGIVDLVHGVVERDDGPAARLTTKERELLAYLVEHPGQDLDRAAILTEVWGYHPDTTSRALDTAVKGLRRKIERDRKAPDHLLTVWGTGYRFEPMDEDEAVSDDLVGRRDEVELVRRVLRSSAPRVVIHGTGGVGKTRLALEATRGRNAVFVPLVTVDSVEKVAAAVARQLPASDLPLSARLHRVPVLVLDNAEHLGPAVADVVTSWLEAAPKLRLVVTSRHRLELPGATAVALAPLGSEERVALLCRRLERVRPVAADDDRIRALADRLDGLPLAIELVAAWGSVYGPAELFAQADALLQQGAGPRGGGMEGVVARSLELLRPSERDTLRVACGFVGWFRSTDLVALTGRDEAAAEVDVLRDASLVEGTERLQVLPLLRRALARLEPPTQEERVRHARLVVGAAREDQEAPRWLAELDAVFGDDTLPSDVIARAGMARVLLSKHRAEDGVTFTDAERMVAAAEASGDEELLAEARVTACNVVLRLGQASEASMVKAVQSARAVGRDDLVAMAQTRLGTFYRLESRLPEAEGALQEALSLEGSSEQQAYGWSELGMVRRALGRWEDAVQAQHRATGFARRARPAVLVPCLHRLGVTEGLMGRIDACRGPLGEALELCEDQGYAAVGHQVSMSLAALEYEGGDVHSAAALLEDAGGDLESWFHHAVTESYRAMVLIQRGELEEASRCCAEALATCGERRGPAWSQSALVDAVRRLYLGEDAEPAFLRVVEQGDEPNATYARGYIARMRGVGASFEAGAAGSALVQAFAEVVRGPSVPPMPTLGIQARLLATWLQKVGRGRG